MKWIKCSDQLPPIETPVLVYFRGEIRIGERRVDSPGHEDHYDAYRYWDDPLDEGQEWQDDDITHWMNLPEEPK